MSRPNERDNHKPAAPSPLSVIGGGYLATAAVRATATVAPADHPVRSATEADYALAVQDDS
ncbi:hypothetical protein [Streptomyces sp. NBC_00878]|uniref:hypothetical protein n=1 Tax=Streptomyces sp. NBC_00878 TaxID=2975854 RepID=UPI0022559C18|nr:hypothetical protein [Streptomyces sp. NBC_00878]MCX4910570.1 hypothetical protein [Streptomyces sp. NBC_00878]